MFPQLWFELFGFSISYIQISTFGSTSNHASCLLLILVAIRQFQNQNLSIDIDFVMVCNLYI